MKRLLTIPLFLLALIIATPIAHAEHDEGIPHDQIGTFGQDYGADYNATYEATTPAEYKAAEKTPIDSNTLGKDGDKFGVVMTWIMTLFAWLLGVAALILDYAVYYTVVKMGAYVNSLSSIGVTWQILRDIGNIALIFGFLAAGIATILNLDLYGWKTSVIPKLIIAAVLINFSLFFAEVVIDTGNLIATQFYTQINGGGPIKAPTFSTEVIVGNGIANTMMAKLGFQSIYDAGKPVNQAVFFDNSTTWTTGFMSIILFIITAFVFFALAFILIARFVILLLLIIISPVAFAGYAVPKLEGQAQKWFSELINQTMTAPVLLLLLYVALRVITDSKFLTITGGDGTTQPNWNGTTNGDFLGFASIFLSFLVAMGLLLAVIIASKKMSAFGGDWATKMGGKLSFGVAAFAGRRTLGRVSNYAARTIRSSRLGATSTGRILAGAADRGAKASFDMRGVKAFGGLGALKMGELGKPQEGGYRKTLEEGAKVREEHAKTLSENQKRERDALRYQAWQMEQQHPELRTHIAPLQAQYHAAMTQGNLAQAQQLQNQINAIAAQAQIPQNALAQYDNAQQNIIQVTRTIQDRQVQYADSLNWWWSRHAPTSGSAARNEAARQVRNDLIQSPEQRLLQQLQRVLNQPQPQPPPQQPPPPPPPPAPSSIRFKEQVSELTSGLATVMALKPKAYQYKDIPSLHITSQHEHLGFIAEDALGIEPRLVEVGTDGEAQAFNYQEYTAVLTKAVQEQQMQIDLLKKEISEIKKQH